MEKRPSLYRSILGDEYGVTSLAPEDHGLDQNAYGTDALLTPENATIDDDTEDDVALSALLDDLSPGEASRVLATMRPLSHDESEIVDETPGLEGLRRVDDAENQQWLNDHSKQGYRGMDTILDDASYGEDMNKEERLERQGIARDANDSDLGWGIPGVSALKKAARKTYRLGKKGVTAPLSVAKRLGKAALKFVPGRDAGKAKVVRNLYNKLVVEHANWLAIADQRAGRQVQSLDYYRNASKPWAKAQIAQGGLPTKFVVNGADSLGADIVGGDFVGSWWNPLSWFVEKSNVIVNQTQGARSPVGPDGQPADDSQMPYSDEPPAPDADASAPAESADAQSQGDVTTGIAGEDSLGAFSTEILSGPVARRRPSKDDELVEVAAIKLRGGRPLSAGELAVLATLARGGHPRARQIYAVLLKHGAAVSGDEAGAWVHKLNPAYWLKSSEEKKLKDVEVEKWKENARLQEDLEKRKKALSQAERTKTAKEAVDAAKAQAAATEAQLKAIEASLAGVLLPGADQSGAFDSLVGHEKPTPIAKVVEAALNKAGLLARAKVLYAKIASGKPLDSSELKDAGKVAAILHRTKVVHGDLYAEVPYYLSEVHGAFVGARLCGNIEKALHRCDRCRRATDALSKTLSSGRPLTPREKKAAVAVAHETRSLQHLVRSHAAPGAYEGLDKKTALEKAVVLGAAKAAMTDAEKKMVSAIAKLAKAGNPRAQRSLDELRKSGAVVGGDHVGLSISSAFKYATAPIWVPAKGVAKAAKWTGRKLGIVKSSSSSPEDVRIARLRASAKRRAAADARARAADAQTEAEMRAQQSIAAAADAEAEAADAEALSKEAAMRTREIEANPSQAAPADAEDSSGAFVGSWSSEVGDAKEKKILDKASEKSPTGAKIRAGARLYSKAKRGDKQSRKAIATMVAKAKKGDPQATADVQAVQAGRLAVLAKRKAQKKEAHELAKVARKKKVLAVQRKLEVAVANKLVRAERKHQIKKLSKVERLSATGNKQARAYVKSQVDLAKGGDPKAQKRVELMKLARQTRAAAPTKRERRNLAQASKLYRQAAVKRDPKAVRQIQIIQAAAKAGNPNAKRAVKRLQLAHALETAAAAGTVAALVSRKSKGKPTKQAKAEEVARAKAKLASGTATREELAAGARAAQSLGDKKTTADLALAASTAPSATETLQKTAAAVAAKNAGNPQAKQAMQSDLEASKSGDPDAIRRTANVVAVNTIDDLKQGKPVSPAMRDAVNLQERAAAGDPVAREEVKRITEAATSPNPPAEATAAAVTLAAAAVTAKAMASKPSARAEFLEKVNAVPPEARPAAEAELVTLNKKAEDGTITAEEGARGVRLAERLGKTKVAMNIAAKAPPLDVEDPRSSLPDTPQAPITGPVSLLVESLRALTFSTRDPLANWREGLTSRSQTVAPADSSGWSPFAFFRQHPLVAPGTALAASATSFLTALSSRRGSAAPAAPARAPQAAPAAPAAPIAQAAPAPDESPATSSGSEKTLKDYVADALKTKQMSRADFNRAVEVHAGPGASKTKKETIGKTLLEFLTPRGIKIVP